MLTRALPTLSSGCMSGDFEVEARQPLETSGFYTALDVDFGRFWAARSTFFTGLIRVGMV